MSLQSGVRESVAFPDMAGISNEAAVIPPSIASVFPKQEQEPQVLATAQKGGLWNQSGV